MSSERHCLHSKTWIFKTFGWSEGKKNQQDIQNWKYNRKKPNLQVLYKYKRSAILSNLLFRYSTPRKTEKKKVKSENINAIPLQVEERIL